MKKIKKSIITKKIKNYKINRQIRKSYIPKAGDVAVFKVLNIGKHKALQGVNGNNSYLFPGDLILAAFGTRYAANQFEGYVPDRYYPRYQILGQGGVVGVLESMHERYKNIGPTEVRLVGYAVDENNRVVNTKYYEEKPAIFNPFNKRDFPIILSLGSGMDSGKTTTAAYLSRGFYRQGKKVAYIKLTGTVYAKDCSFVRDGGAFKSIDFSYVGFPSTYMCEPDELLNLYETLLQKVEVGNPDVVIIEIADGLLQRETYMLLHHDEFMKQIDYTVLSAVDSLSVKSGIEYMENIEKPPVLLSGVFTASPLMIKEVKQFTHIPVFTLEDFLDKKKFNLLFPPFKDEPKMIAHGESIR